MKESASKCRTNQALELKPIQTFPNTYLQQHLHTQHNLFKLDSRCVLHQVRNHERSTYWIAVSSRVNTQVSTRQTRFTADSLITHNTAHRAMRYSHMPCLPPHPEQDPEAGSV